MTNANINPTLVFFINVFCGTVNCVLTPLHENRKPRRHNVSAWPFDYLRCRSVVRPVGRITVKPMTASRFHAVWFDPNRQSFVVYVCFSDVHGHFTTGGQSLGVNQRGTEESRLFDEDFFGVWIPMNRVSFFCFSALNTELVPIFKPLSAENKL